LVMITRCCAISDVTQAEMIRAMSGRDISVNEDFRPQSRAADVIMEVHGLAGARFRDVSFSLFRGEILGFAGLVGAGRSEVMQTIFGFLRAQAGAVTVEGKPWKLNDPACSVKSGMLYLSEERKQHGIFPFLSLRENIGLSVLSLTKGVFGINNGRERDVVQKIIDDYGIRTSGMNKRISQLSGGNQQKAIIGRAMATRPRVLIFDEPTKGIDIRTKTEIYKIMKRLAEEGVGVILVSSELDELKKCASRIVTMHNGVVSRIFDSTEVSNEILVGALFGTETKDHASE